MLTSEKLELLNTVKDCVAKSRIVTNGKCVVDANLFLEALDEDIITLEVEQENQINDVFSEAADFYHCRNEN